MQTGTPVLLEKVMASGPHLGSNQQKRGNLQSGMEKAIVRAWIGERGAGSGDF
jgi:hypothetical protein